MEIPRCEYGQVVAQRGQFDEGGCECPDESTSGDDLAMAVSHIEVYVKDEKGQMHFEDRLCFVSIVPLWSSKRVEVSHEDTYQERILTERLSKVVILGTYPIDF